MMKSIVINRKPGILIFTNIFPSVEKPNVGFYVYEQVKRLKKIYDIKVIMAKPSSKNKMEDNAPAVKSLFEGIEIYQPEYSAIPKIGVFMSGYQYYRCVKRIVADISREFTFDLIMAYWTYPDGDAAARIAKEYKVPMVLRPRGSDINVYAGRKLLRPLIMKSLRHARRILPVSDHLRRRIIQLGIKEEKTMPILNGIDADQFFIMDKDSCRRELNLPPGHRLVLFAGNLIEIKGIDVFIEAIKLMDREINVNTDFYFLGTGPLADQLRIAAKSLKYVSIHLVGDVAHDKLRVWMNACDLLCLPSLHEGCPNVVLESLACGLPVVASDVGGVGELINRDDLGIMVPARDSARLAEALGKGLSHNWIREDLVNRVKDCSWDKVIEQLNGECKKLLNGHSDLKAKGVE